MNPIQPHPYNLQQFSDASSGMALGATVFFLLIAALYLAIGIYFIVMPILIYLRLGRIARAVEATDFTQKSVMAELKGFIELQHKIEANAEVQTTLLKNVDQNLAMGINKVLTK